MFGRVRHFVLFMFLFAVQLPPAGAETPMKPDHGPWGALLQDWLVLPPPEDGGAAPHFVDYAGLKASAQGRAALAAYIDSLAAIDPALLSRDEQFAFWVNLYNARTVQVVVEHYPVASIRDISISPGLFARGPWGRKLVRVAGRDLAQAVAAPATEPVDLRLLAPTVAVSQAPIAEVLAALRNAGFAPAAEDSTGAIVDLRSRGSRVPAPGRRRGYRHNLTPTDQTLGAIVAVLRKVAANPSGIRLDPAVAMSELQHAAHHQESVVIGYVDPAGLATQRVVAPINVRGGQLTAYDSAAGRVREFAIHRVTSVASAESG